MTDEELYAYWNLWFEQAQATKEMDKNLYSHGVFLREPDTQPRLVAVDKPKYQTTTSK